MGSQWDLVSLFQPGRADAGSRAGAGGHRGRWTELELLAGEEPGETEVWERREVCPLFTTPGLLPHTCCSVADTQLQNNLCLS